jgi:GT2 family glycosyltransferase
MLDLSIVLINKNQAWNISRLIESVLRATSSVHSKEIILVDSASTDETVALAGRYPITILRLRPGQRLSPAIGRYIGSQRARGDLVLFLDGDTELVEGWLARALQKMRDEPGAGVLTGKVINCQTSAAGRAVPLDEVYKGASREVLWGSYDGGGAAMYRRSLLEKVGTFNPGLFADEEPELCLRIRHAGYRVLELDYPIVWHYNDAPEAISNVLSRRRRNFLLGVGQCLRYHLGDDLLWPYIKERGRWSLAAMLSLGIGVAAALRYLVAGDPTWFASWVFAVALVVAGMAWRKRSLRGALIGAFHRVLQVEGLLRGFFRQPLRPENYSWCFDVVKECSDGLALTDVPMRGTSPACLFNRDHASDPADAGPRKPAFPTPFPSQN